MTELTERLGITLPVLQAPMAGVQGGRLAGAVSRAGGLGAIPCAMLSEAQVRTEFETAGPVNGQLNLNFFCHSPPVNQEAAEHHWRQVLKPYYDEFSVSPSSAGAGRQPFTQSSMDLVASLMPRAVSFHFGLPDASFVARLHDLGICILSSATTVAEARYLEQAGADVIIAQGREAGGHRGMFLDSEPDSQPGLDELLTGVLDNVSVPVVAAGGISTPAAVRKMLSRGAAAVQAGTAYLLCPETDSSVVHRRAIGEAEAGSTVLTNIFSGRLARSLTNRMVKELGALRDDVPAFPGAAGPLAPLRAAAEKSGTGDFSPLWCGTDTSGCREVSAEEQTRWLASA